MVMPVKDEVYRSKMYQCDNYSHPYQVVIYATGEQNKYLKLEEYFVLDGSVWDRFKNFLFRKGQKIVVGWREHAKFIDLETAIITIINTGGDPLAISNLKENK